jgi:cytidine deaminase
MCRQSLSEFCDDDFVVIVDEWGETTLGELFPSGMENID